MVDKVISLFSYYPDSNQIDGWIEEMWTEHNSRSWDAALTNRNGMSPALGNNNNL